MRRCSGRSIAGSLVGPWLTILAQMLLITMMEAPCHGWTVRQRHSRLLPWIHRPAPHDRNNNNEKGLPPVVAPTTRPEQAKQEQVTKNDHYHHRSSDGCSPPPLGWIREVQRRETPSSKTHVCQVTVGHYNGDSDDDNENDTVTFPLPIVPHDDSLATAVWPAGLAAAILCQQPSGNGGLRALLSQRNCSVLELGAGLGIFGLTAAQYAANVLLTDQDATVIAAMQQQSASMPDNARAYQLDWRDNEHHDNTITTPVDVVIGSDVAYYYHLLRPLMDTAQSFFKPNTGSLFLVVGQANRKSLWDLYHNIVQGCYNQRTDMHEPPWPGIADVRLFRLHLEDWVEDEQQELRPSDDNDDDDGNNHDNNDDQKDQHPPITTRTRTTIKKVDYEDIPIAVLVYQSPGFVALDRLTEQDDYIATPADYAAMEMSF
jgi:2-polyprenyl-3-methyl-5-hydroxy-6-metoxy-1,4-benzoquinol methylase